jgi:choline dehydrogenase-like flavoprotein
VQDEEALVAHLRAEGSTSFHPVGTCRMGTDPEAVVDPRLRLRGMADIRVVDASIMPAMVSGNTQAATMMIAERGAAMILEDARKGGAGAAG